MVKLDARSKLIEKRIVGFLVSFFNFAMVLNINSRDFKRRSMKMSTGQNRDIETRP